jgi:hypothetical protein
MLVKTFSYFYSKIYNYDHQTLFLQSYVFHDLLPVVKLLPEGLALIPIVGILRGGVNQFEHNY